MEIEIRCGECNDILDFDANINGDTLILRTFLCEACKQFEYDTGKEIGYDKGEEYGQSLGYEAGFAAAEEKAKET